MDAPTLILVPFLAAALLFAMVRAAALMRTWRESATGPTVPERDRDRIALEDEKHRLLATLRDLEHEYLLGKLSDEDYDGLKRYFEGEAVRVIRELDADDAGAPP